MSKIVQEFFAKNPDAVTCFVAAGLAFPDKEAADEFLAGCNVKPLEYTKDGGPVKENPLQDIINEQADKIKKLEAELSVANAKLNATLGTGEESAKVKELNGKLDDLTAENELLKEALADLDKKDAELKANLPEEPAE